MQIRTSMDKLSVHDHYLHRLHLTDDVLDLCDRSIELGHCKSIWMALQFHPVKLMERVSVLFR